MPLTDEEAYWASVQADFEAMRNFVPVEDAVINPLADLQSIIAEEMEAGKDHIETAHMLNMAYIKLKRAGERYARA